MRQETRRARRRQDEAARWYVLFQERELTPRDIKAWNRWEAVPENRQAFDAIERIWEALSEMGSPAAHNAHAAVEWLTKRNARARSLKPRWPLVAALAAGLALAAIGLRFIAPIKWNSVLTESGTSAAATGVAEHKDIVLADGSKIALGARTAITAEITDQARTITLTRGEALFQVKRDATRPFRVLAGSGTITAIGTTFNVRHREDEAVVVTVTEGVVEVGGQSVMTPRRLSRGNEIAYDRAGRLSAPRKVDEQFSATWRSGLLRYQSEPLRNVLADVNRYSKRPLVLGDPAAGQRLYSGTVLESDVEEWIDNLAKLYLDLEVAALGSDQIVIGSRSSGP